MQVCGLNLNCMNMQRIYSPEEGSSNTVLSSFIALGGRLMNARPMSKGEADPLGRGLTQTTFAVTVNE